MSDRSKIEIVDPDPAWAERFAELAGGIRRSLGDVALRIDHIGSTAVPGLAAKDIIDVQVSVADLDHPRIRTSLVGLGMTWRDEITKDHRPPGVELEPAELEKRYAQLRDGKSSMNCHVRLDGRFNQRYSLLCRDYLRTHTPTRDAYAEIKRQLARYFPDDVDAYYDIKDPACDLFMTAAREWAEWSRWAPSASDG